MLYTDKLLPDSLKKKLFEPHVKVEGPISGYAGYGWFTSKQKLPSGEKDVNMIWHPGGINGFLTTINRFPESETLIVILDNTSQSVAEEKLIPVILEIMNGGRALVPRPELIAMFRQRIKDGSVSKAVTFLNSLTPAQLTQYDLNGAETLINRSGYQYLNSDKNIDHAIKLFALNMKLFPKSSNVYDSYAEALMKKRDYTNAIANYRKSYEMDSTNRRALFMIDRMKMEEKQDTIRVMIDGHAMDLFISGTEGPIVVLEAGGDSDHTCWSNIVPGLSEFARVVTYDRPGYLNSVACNRPRTASRVASELYNALQEAGIKGPYVIGGWSWGGFFARAFASLYPDQTRGVLLVDPAHETAYQRMAISEADAFTRTLEHQFTENYAAVDEYAAMIPVMHEMVRMDNSFTGNVELLIATKMADWRAVEQPLKMIWIDELKSWAKRRKNTFVQEIDAGHFIQKEKPAAVVEAIKRLIASEQQQGGAR